MRSVCIVIPCFNEASRLPVNFLADFYRHPAAEGVYFCLVNDGSIDQTMTVLTKVQAQFPDKVTIVDLKDNVGKAEAIRQGVMTVWEKGYEWIAYFDADLATPLTELFHFESVMANRSMMFVCGSRMKRMGVKVERNALRHYIGRVFATLASMTLNLPVYDTQCGAKLLRADVVKAVFTEKFMTRWLFDVEIFARLIYTKGREYVLQHTLEVPLNQWIEIGGSKVNWMHAFYVPFQLMKIKQKYKL